MTPQPVTVGRIFDSVMVFTSHSGRRSVQIAVRRLGCVSMRAGYIMYDGLVYDQAAAVTHKRDKVEYTDGQGGEGQRLQRVRLEGRPVVSQQP